MATNFRQNHFHLTHSCFETAISQFWFRDVKEQYFDTLYAIFIAISPLTPEITHGVSVIFRTRWQKSTSWQIYQQALEQWTELYQHFSINRYMYGNYKTDISFTAVQGTLLWQSIYFGAFCRRRNWPSSLFAVPFRNKMKFRKKQSIVL